MKNKTKTIFLVCTGLGRVNRGFESFTRECFDALYPLGGNLAKFYLFKGSGKELVNSREFTCPNIPRSFTRSYLGDQRAYLLENKTFFLFLLPKIIWYRPSVIFVSDFYLACYLSHLKKYIRLPYKVIFSNGGPSGPPYIFDHVHQLTNIHLNEAILFGEPIEKHTVIPYGFNIKENFNVLSANERVKLRSSLRLPIDKKIILSVGAVNSTHKRMNYLIEEVSTMENTFLVILGNFESETMDILELANQKLPGRFSIKTVEKDQVSDYYACVDVFALASLSEGFGRVFVEALSAGLAVCVHDCDLTREILKNWGYFANLTKQGALAELLGYVLTLSETKNIRINRHNFAYEHYSWDKLKQSYLDMINLE